MADQTHLDSLVSQYNAAREDHKRIEAEMDRIGKEWVKDACPYQSGSFYQAPDDQKAIRFYLSPLVRGKVVRVVSVSHHEAWNPKGGPVKLEWSIRVRRILKSGKMGQSVQSLDANSFVDGFVMEKVEVGDAA